MEGKQLRIISDGTGRGTKVLDADGNKIPGMITKVEWWITKDEPGTARITFANVELEVETFRVER